MDEKVYLGIDVGSVSAKITVIDQSTNILFDSYTRIKGKPVETTKGVLSTLFEKYPLNCFAGCMVTGCNGKIVARALDVPFINEVIAQAKAAAVLYPCVKTIIEMGGEDSKLILLAKDHHGATVIRDFEMNTNCAAGTGSFLDQQAARLGINIEDEFGALALKSAVPPRIAGRCSVFAKSDMIHLQQLATPDYDIVAGLCYALARNFVSNLGKGKSFATPIAFQGGVAANAGVVRAFKDILNLDDHRFIIPQHFASMGAIGAVLVGVEQNQLKRFETLVKLDELQKKSGQVGFTLEPLQPHHNEDKSVGQAVKRDAAHNDAQEEIIPAYLGVDVGSISTCLAVIDERLNLLAKAYLMTAGRPLEAVKEGLRQIQPQLEQNVTICGVCTTGSGRYLTGDFIGADVVVNEITAQATGAIHIDKNVDTVFEIGGQDSKYISLSNGVVTDFEMNHACAAGTGSFLEEQAERLGVNIKDEFARIALACETPLKLGERCTVFMESDVVYHQQQGASLAQLLSGLAYSIVYNYLNKVVGYRKIGSTIFFQGGVATNAAVVSAFEAVLGKKVYVPENNEVTGAIGAAIIAKERTVTGEQSKFRGFDLAERKYEQRSFECPHCSNACSINEVIIEGEAPLYYGSRCDRYNVKKCASEGDDIPDLFGEREKLRLRPYNPKPEQPRGRIGIPNGLFNYELYPFWQAFFAELGYETVLSSPTNNRIINEGVEAVTSQTCFPVKVFHGHVKDLVRKDINYVFLPSVIELEPEYLDQEYHYLCPYVQSIAHQIHNAVDMPEHINVLQPVIHFQRGREFLINELVTMAGDLGVTKDAIAKALDKAYAFQEAFRDVCCARGREVLESLREGDKACVIVSRPYNGFDKGVNLDIAKKLRKLGVIAIPMDFLTITDDILGDDWDNMFWKYGQRILKTGQVLARDDRLYPVYISNFSCGPDSFLTTFFKKVMGEKPVLVLEIDEHSADAGIVTRLEAFLDSLAGFQAGAHKEAGKDNERRLFNVISSNHHDRTIYIPYMCEHAHALAASFRACGLDAEVLAPSDETSLELGSRYTTGKECLPAIVTAGDMLKKISEGGFDPANAAFFMPSGTGPCRFGNYNKLHKLILQETGYGDIPVLSPNQGKNFYRDFKNLKKDPTRKAWQALVACDLMIKTLHRLRPREKDKGATDEAFQQSLKLVCDATEKNESITKALAEAREIFDTVKVDWSKRIPLIGVVGEIYVRSHAFSNNHIIRTLEELGAEVELASFAEWIYYTNFTRMRRNQLDREGKELWVNRLKQAVQKFDERRLARKIRMNHHSNGGKFVEPATEEILHFGNRYLDDSFEGEAILSVGKTVEFIEGGASGIVNVMPFTCMPGTIVAGMLETVKGEYTIPIISIAYDGQEHSSSQTRVEAFVHQCKQYMDAQ